jgi:hypothetical protein
LPGEVEKNSRYRRQVGNVPLFRLIKPEVIWSIEK